MGDSEPEDVAAEEEEENFEEGMQRRAQDYELADADQDNKLDFDEFCNMVKSREEGAENYTEEQLKERFDALDADGSGKVDMSEYLRFSLREALLRSQTRVVDLFRQWDEDRDNTIDKLLARPRTGSRDSGAAQQRACAAYGQLCARD